jgi:hypothetical protein
MMAGSILIDSLVVVEALQDPGLRVLDRVVWSTSRWPMSLDANSEVPPCSLVEQRKTTVLPQFSTIACAVRVHGAGYDTTVQVVGFDEIAALYRQSRRALVVDLVRAKVPPDRVSNWITAHVPANVESQHRQKFVSDVLAELEHLDASRIGGLGITRQELEAWQELRPTAPAV